MLVACARKLLGVRLSDGGECGRSELLRHVGGEDSEDRLDAHNHVLRSRASVGLLLALDLGAAADRKDNPSVRHPSQIACANEDQASNCLGQLSTCRCVQECRRAREADARKMAPMGMQYM